jgi:outer membrane receptor protein involved in Fe transport
MNAEWLIFSEKVTQNDVHVYHKVLLENYKDFRMELQQRALHYAKWKQKFRFGVLHTTISFQSTKEIRASQKNGSSLFRRETDKVGTLGVQMDLFLRPTSFLTMNSGVEFYNDLVQSNKIDKDLSNSQITYLRGLYPNQSKYRYASIYSLQHWNWKKIHLETGLRYSAYKIQIADTSLGKVILKPSALVSNAAVTFDLSSSDHLYLSLQNAFRAPNVDDMGTLGYVDNRYEIPAYDLKPERSVNYEVGYKYAVRSNAASVALYYANIRNLITRVLAPSIPNINSLPVYYKENTDHAYVKGITIQYNYTQQHWNITTNASYQLGQNFTRNEPMRRIPPLFGDVTIGHLRNKYAVYFQIAAASSQKRLAAGDISDNRIGKNGTEGWVVCNMNIHKKFKYISMSGGVQNIFNQQYKYHGSGIYVMGRSYFFQWQFNFKD